MNNIIRRIRDGPVIARGFLFRRNGTAYIGQIPIPCAYFVRALEDPQSGMNRFTTYDHIITGAGERRLTFYKEKNENFEVRERC